MLQKTEEEFSCRTILSEACRMVKKAVISDH